MVWKCRLAFMATTRAGDRDQLARAISYRLPHRSLGLGRGVALSRYLGFRKVRRQEPQANRGADQSVGCVLGQLFRPLVHGLAADSKRIPDGPHGAAEDPYCFVFGSDGAHDHK